MTVSSQSCRPKGKVEGRDLGDEYLIYDRPTDQVHVLNGTAREIYLLCDGTRTVEQVVEALVEKYGVDESTASGDTERTLEELIELGVLAWN